MDKPSATAIEKSVAGNKTRDKAFAIVGLIATFVGMLTLAALLFDLASDGLARIKPHFFTSFPSRFPGQAGILSAWVGTILVMIVTALAAIPIGIGAGIYLEEYAAKNWLTALIEINIANLAGDHSHSNEIKGNSALTGASGKKAMKVRAPMVISGAVSPIARDNPIITPVRIPPME